LAVGPEASAVGEGVPHVGVLLTERTTTVATAAAAAAPTPIAVTPTAPIPLAPAAPAPLVAVVFTASATFTGDAGDGAVGEELLCTEDSCPACRVTQFPAKSQAWHVPSRQTTFI
jgi:hypothetical protein